MELNDIKIFIELYKNRSVSKTAERLHYTQSNISTRLMKLEKEFHTTLFIRTKSGLEILPATERFFHYAQEIQQLQEKLYSEFSLEQQQFHIGSTQLLSRLYYPSLYKKTNLFHLHTANLNKLSRDFTRNVFDIIITYTKSDPSDDIFELHKSEPLVWCRSDHFTDTPDERPNIIVNRDKLCPLRVSTFQTISHKKLKSPLIEVDTLDLMVSLLHTSNSIALLPQKIALEDTQLKEYSGLETISFDIYAYCHTKLQMDTLADLFHE